MLLLTPSIGLTDGNYPFKPTPVRSGTIGWIVNGYNVGFSSANAPHPMVEPARQLPANDPDQQDRYERYQHQFKKKRNQKQGQSGHQGYACYSPNVHTLVLFSDSLKADNYPALTTKRVARCCLSELILTALRG